VRCWGPEADVAIRKVTQANWGLEGHDTDKHDEDDIFVMKTSAVEDAEGINESPPPPSK
jgi:hypothetical protein